METFNDDMQPVQSIINGMLVRYKILFISSDPSGIMPKDTVIYPNERFWIDYFGSTAVNAVLDGNGDLQPFDNLSNIPKSEFLYYANSDILNKIAEVLKKHNVSEKHKDNLYVPISDSRSIPFRLMQLSLKEQAEELRDIHEMFQAMKEFRGRLKSVSFSWHDDKPLNEKNNKKRKLKQFTIQHEGSVALFQNGLVLGALSNSRINPFYDVILALSYPKGKQELVTDLFDFYIEVLYIYIRKFMSIVIERKIHSLIADLLLTTDFFEYYKKFKPNRVEVSSYAEPRDHKIDLIRSRLRRRSY